MLRWVLAGCTALWAGCVGAQSDDDNVFWVVWERTLPELRDCDGATCDGGIYFSHRIDGMTSDVAHRFFGRMADFAQTPGDTNIRTQRSPMCFQDGGAVVMPDVTALDVATATQTLRGLEGVLVDLRGVRGPASADGEFGTRAQAATEARFADAGIPILTREAAEALPANAVLTMRYSVEVQNCRPWSVSLSLKQRVVLARAPHLMLHTTTWSASARQSEDNSDYDAMDAMEEVILKFVQAWKDAHATGQTEG
ncbi:MAG: hypothetical protein AAFO58_08925 [Pseudomonadota bacterium]